MSKTTAKQDGKETEKFVISGKAYWSYVFEPHEDSGKFLMDVSIDDKTAEKLKNLGISIKSKDKDLEGKPENNRGQYVTLKSEFRPKIYDAKKKEVVKKTLIGNSSDVNVLTHVYNWAYKAKKGLSLGLDAVQIVNLVEYKEKDSIGDIFDEITAGYSYNEVNSEDENYDTISESRTPPLSKDNPF